MIEQMISWVNILGIKGISFSVHWGGSAGKVEWDEEQPWPSYDILGNPDTGQLFATPQSLAKHSKSPIN